MLIKYDGLPTSKNIKKTRLGGGREMRNAAVSFFYSDFLSFARYRESEKAALKEAFASGPHCLIITVWFCTDNQLFDTQNYIDHLSDALGMLLEINDRWFYFNIKPRVFGKPGVVIRLDLQKETFLIQKKRYVKLYGNPTRKVKKNARKRKSGSLGGNTTFGSI